MRVLAWLLIAISYFGSQAPAGPDSRTAFLTLIDRPRVALDPVVASRTETTGIIEERLSFASESGQRVPTLLLKTKSSTGRRPVVIVLHGTGGRKEGLAGRLKELAARDFIAVAIDARYHGERATPAAAGTSPYQDAIARAYRTQQEHPFLYDTVWDVMRLIDYLNARNDVDASRIGLTGISKGGMETYLAAAADPRVAVAVPMIGVQSFRWALEHSAWDSRAWTLRPAVEAAASSTGDDINARFMRKFYDRVAPGLYGEFDGPAMLPLIAPRPLLVINGDSDPRTPLAGVRQCIAAAERAYRSLGAADRLVLHLQPDAGHEVTPAADRAAVEWLERWLKPHSS